MKRRDVFIQILHEVSGKPKDFISDALNIFFKIHPAPKMDEEISDAEYQQTLEGMRKEEEGIKDWLMRGNLSWILRNSDPAGSA